MLNTKNSTKLIGVLLLTLFSTTVFAGSPTDSRYSQDMNLPFNAKAGDINPQTGSFSLGATDFSLPGRAGLDFSFGRSWTSSQSNVFNMYRDSYDGQNRLDSTTVERINKMGVGWSSNLPYIYSDFSSGNLILSLFLGGSVFEIDQNGVKNDNGYSNLLGYDLKDMRLYESSLITNSVGERSKYVLVNKDNSKLFFRTDGQILMNQDKSGLNKIWYYYDNRPEGNRLNKVVDTIGREIMFSYDLNGNLSQLSWDVEIGKRDENGNILGYITENRTVQYKYISAEQFPSIAQLSAHIINYKIPYVLSSVTDPMGNVTTYKYEAKKADFTYNKSKTISSNVYLLLNELTSVSDESNANEKYLNKRIFEYNAPTDELYKKDFYNGFFKYYKISRQYFLNRHGTKFNDTFYTYYDEGPDHSTYQYMAKIDQGRMSKTYVYSKRGEANKFNVLEEVITESLDGYSESIIFSYDSEKKKIQERVIKQSNFAYVEDFIYDSRGNLTTHIDRMNLVTTTTYDPVFSMPMIVVQNFTDPFGENQKYKSRTEINTLGQVKKEFVHIKELGVDRAITVAQYTYDEWGNVVESIDADNNKTNVIYDDTFHTFPIKTHQSVTIPSYTTGSVHDNWRMSPDSSQLITQTLWRVFNTDGSAWIEFDNEGYAVEHYYDLLGTEIESIKPNEDDETSFLTSIAPANIPFKYFTENSSFSSFATSRSNNPGARMEIDYQNEFTKTSVDIDTIAGEFKVSGVQKDGLGNVEKEMEYDALDAIYSVRQMEYDNLGNMIAITDPDAELDLGYTKVNGQVVKFTDKTWLIKYDDMGRKLAVSYPETKVGRSDYKYYYYNDRDNSSIVVDPEGREYFEKRDWNGNVTSAILKGNSSTLVVDRRTYVYEYDALDRKVKFTDAMGLNTIYKYDERDQLIQQDYGNGSDFMSYNDLGQIIRKSDRKGQILIFDYDELGRNTSVKHYKSQADFDTSTVDQTIVVDFDKRGNVIRVDGDNLIEHYVFDHSNRALTLDRYAKNADYRAKIESVTGIIALDQTLSFNYVYNDAGMVTKMTYPNGAVHKFAYDGTFGRLESISEGDETLQNPFVKSMEYNKSSVVTRMDYANDTFQRWDFDNRKRISNIKVNKGIEIIENLFYSYNGIGDITSINDQYKYEYDAFGQITGATILKPGEVDQYKLVQEFFGAVSGETTAGMEYNLQADIFPEITPDGRIDGQDHLFASRQDEFSLYDVEEFTYDANGNRLTLTQNGDLYRYVYGERNRLNTIYKTKIGETEFKFADYTYDANGNTKSRIFYDKLGAVIESTTFNFDTLNRLIDTTSAAGKTSYTYDNEGNRFTKETPHTLTVYLRHGEIAVAMDIQVKVDQTVERGQINRYVLSGDLLAGRIKEKVAENGAVTRSKSFYHLDHLNSTKVVTDETGIVVVNYTYRAFGEQLKRLDALGNDTGDLGQYSYVGKELDDNSNLYYFNARYYDATTGRFINVDPIQDGSNWYVYCNNNPLNKSDPTGLKAKGVRNKGGKKGKSKKSLNRGRKRRKAGSGRNRSNSSRKKNKGGKKNKPRTTTLGINATITNPFLWIKNAADFLTGKQRDLFFNVTPDSYTFNLGLYHEKSSTGKSKFGLYGSAGYGYSALPNAQLNIEGGLSNTNADTFLKGRAGDIDIGILAYGGSLIFNDDEFFGGELSYGASLMPADAAVYRETSNYIPFSKIKSNIKDFYDRLFSN